MAPRITQGASRTCQVFNCRSVCVEENAEALVVLAHAGSYLMHLMLLCLKDLLFCSFLAQLVEILNRGVLLQFNEST